MCDCFPPFCPLLHTTGPQLEATLVGLTTVTERVQLGQLPMLVTALGEEVKGNRNLMWAYAAIKHTVVSLWLNSGGLGWAL